MHRRVWYACYGSNISESRFLQYIKGGQPVGSSKNYTGCNDKTLPLDKREIIITRELYFAKNSKSWGNMGIAFIRTFNNPSEITYGRMYLITDDQFIDVIKQETNTNTLISIDLDKVIFNGSLVWKEHSFYGNIIYLGDKDDLPIFTISNENNIEQFNMPSKLYLKTIMIGIRETYDLSSKEIANYFLSKLGIQGNYKIRDVMELIEN